MGTAHQSSLSIGKLIPKQYSWEFGGFEPAMAGIIGAIAKDKIEFIRSICLF
jgi:hypothetical protein